MEVVRKKGRERVKKRERRRGQRKGRWRKRQERRKIVRLDLCLNYTFFSISVPQLYRPFIFIH